MKTHHLIRFSLLQASTCLACYVFTTLDAGNVDWKENPTTIAEYYTSLIDQGVDPSIQSVWFFEVKSCRDVGILITTNSDLSGVLYEIIIGASLNSKIVLRSVPSSNGVGYSIESVLNCSRFIRFWLSWTQNGAVSLGGGDIQGQNIYFTTSVHSTAVGGIGVNSCYGTDADWRYGIPSSVRVPDSCSVTQTTEPVSPTSELDSQSTSETIKCTPTPSMVRTEKTTGTFKRETGIQFVAMNQISSSTQCTELQCAKSCLSHSGCWYFRFGTSGSGCQPCFFYASSVTSCHQGAPVDGYLYRLV